MTDKPHHGSSWDYVQHESEVHRTRSLFLDVLHLNTNQHRLIQVSTATVGVPRNAWIISFPSSSKRRCTMENNSSIYCLSCLYLHGRFCATARWQRDGPDFIAYLPGSRRHTCSSHCWSRPGFWPATAACSPRASTASAGAATGLRKDRQVMGGSAFHV